MKHILLKSFFIFEKLVQRLHEFLSIFTDHLNAICVSFV